jgi:XTP/dITP diphosphohydrolase
LNAEDSLRSTNRKFIRRFQYIEQQLHEEDKNISDVTLQEMDKHWNSAKTDID